MLLEEAFEKGRERWGKIGSMTLEQFVRHCDAAGVDVEGLRSHAEDLYLVAAALTGEAAALEAFEGEVLGRVARWLAPMRLADDVLDEVRQALRVKLLTGPTPRLAAYRASGALGAWVRVSAVRTALDLVAARPGADALPSNSPAGSLFNDPERELIRRRYGPAFQRAINQALGALTTRQRSLLRFHYVLGMSVDAIGRVYGVHKATAARWLVDTREELEAAVTARVWDALGVPTADFHSIWRLLESGLKVSFSRVLARTSETDAPELQ